MVGRELGVRNQVGRSHGVGFRMPEAVHVCMCMCVAYEVGVEFCTYIVCLSAWVHSAGKL